MGKNGFLGVLKSAFWHHGVLPFLWAVRALNVNWVKVLIHLMITVLMDYGTEVVKINMLLAFIHQKDMSQILIEFGLKPNAAQKEKEKIYGIN